MAKSPRNSDPSEEPDGAPMAQDTQTAQAVVVKRKGKVPAAAWIAAMVVLGGVTAAVVLVVLKPGEGGGEPAAATTAATTDNASDAGASAADVGASDEVADGASDAADEVADEVAGGDVVDGEVADDIAEPEAVDEVVDAAEAGEVDEVADAAEGASEDAVADAEGADGVAADAAPAEVVAAAEVVGDAASAPETVVVKIDPKESTRLNDQGLAARKAGDHKAALQAYEKAVQTNPDNVWARYNYACELALAGKKKEALAELTVLHKAGTSDAKKALAAARKDSDFASIRDMGQFFRLTNF